MKTAIVLSGGGAKGAYELGFWKAIRELGIKFDIVTGTSIGALNGLMMVQNDYRKCFKLWYYMNYDKIFEKELSDLFNEQKDIKGVALNYIKGAIKGGYEVPNLVKVIDDNFDPKKFYNSNIDYGLVTVRFPSLKPVFIEKEKIKPELMKEYLLASASCFPAFKVKNIENKGYIDGGYQDNLPIDLAVKMGADNIIAVDLRAIGRKKGIPSNIPVKLITPNTDIGNFLIMEKQQSRRIYQIGYNDTMKAYNELDGNIYTFRKNSLKRNFNRVGDEFYTEVYKYLDNVVSKHSILKILGKNKEAGFNKILEETMKAFDLDICNIYRTSSANVEIKKKLRKTINTPSKITTIVKNNKLNKLFVNQELICYIYKIIISENRKKTNSLMIMFPKAFLCALYIKSIVL